MVNVELIDKLSKGLDYVSVHDFLTKPRDVSLVLGYHPQVPEEVESYVKLVWETEQAKRRLNKIKEMTDGDVLGINIQEVQDDGRKLTVPLFDSKYRYLMGTRLGQSPNFQINLLGSGAVTVLKAEGTQYFLFGKRAPHMAAVGGRVEVIPQGLIKKADLEKKDPLEVTLRREAQEEIYIPINGDIDTTTPAMTMFALVWTKYWNSAAADFVLRLEDPSVLKRSKRTDKKNHSLLVPPNPKEHTEFYAVPLETLEDFVEEHLHAESEEEKLGVATRNRLKGFLAAEQLLVSIGSID